MTVTVEPTPITANSDPAGQRNDFKASGSTVQSLNSIFRRMNMFPRQDSFKYPDSTSPHVDEMMLQMCGASQYSAEHNRTPALTDESSASLASSDASGSAEQRDPTPKSNFRTSLLISTKLRSISRSTFRSPSNPFFRASIFSVMECKDPKPEVSTSPSIHYHSYAPISEINNLSSERLQWIKSSPKQPVDIYVRQQSTRPQSRQSFFSATNWHGYRSLKILNNDIGALNVRAHDIQPQQKGTGGMKSSNTMPNLRDPKPTKGVFFCKILKVSNKASSKELKVQVELEVNGVKRKTAPVSMEKSGKHSAYATFDEAFLFDVGGPFTCKIAVRAQPVRSRMRLQSLKRRNSNVSMASTTDNEVIFGLADLHYEKIEGMDKATKSFSLGRYRDNIQDKIDGDIEIQLGVHLDVIGRIRESRSQGGLSGRVHADYLTVYSRGTMLPKWTRYWAVVDNDDLYLYDFTYQEEKPPVAIINLNHLRSISTSDDRISLGCAGLSLEMDARCLAKENSVSLDEGEAIEYKMLMLADSPFQASQWRNIFFEYVSVIRKMGVTERHLASCEEDSIDLRFLW